MRISDWSSDVCSSDLATQAAEHVAAEIGMVPDAREHTGVEHLEQQCRYAADHHCVEITMNAPGGRIRTEQPRVPCGKVQIDLARAKTDQTVDLLFDGLAYALHAEEIGTL